MPKRGNMILTTKDGIQVGARIGVETDPDKKQKIVDKFLKATGDVAKTDDQHLRFTGKLPEEPKGVLHITLPRGSWGIMESLILPILSYVPGDIVEIGMGESTEILAEKAQQAGVYLYSCDIQMGGMFKVFDEPLFENHHCYIGRSEDFIKEYGGSPAIVFLDGEHLYETVKQEVEFFLPRIRQGGVMFMHDTMPMLKHSIKPDSKGYNPGDIYKVRQELERDPRYDVFTWPYSAQNMGLTMVMVHDGHRPYWRENGRISGGNETT